MPSTILQPISDKLKPRADRVIIQRLHAEEKTKSGIIIPDNAKEKPQEGEVVAVGPGKWNEDGDKRIPIDVQIGDKVLFGKWSATEIKFEGEELISVKEEDIIAVIK